MGTVWVDDCTNSMPNFAAHFSQISCQTILAGSLFCPGSRTGNFRKLSDRGSKTCSPKMASHIGQSSFCCCCCCCCCCEPVCCSFFAGWNITERSCWSHCLQQHLAIRQIGPGLLSVSRRFCRRHSAIRRSTDLSIRRIFRRDDRKRGRCWGFLWPRSERIEGRCCERIFQPRNWNKNKTC